MKPHHAKPNETCPPIPTHNPTFLPILPICLISLIGLTVEYGWASGEAIIVPYLSHHGVPQWITSTIYLANPTFGLVVQPCLGRWSDEMGRMRRRVPFVVGLGMVTLLGLGMLVMSGVSGGPRPLVHWFHWYPNKDPFAENDADRGDSVSSVNSVNSVISVIMAFIGFGLSDICFDCLLIPGRALLDDVAVPAKLSEEANAVFTAFQLMGRLVALALGSSAMTVTGFWGVYEGEDRHFDAVLTLSALVVFGSVSLVVCFVEDTHGSTMEDGPRRWDVGGEEHRMAKSTNTFKCAEEEFLIKEHSSNQTHLYYQTSSKFLETEQTKQLCNENPICKCSTFPLPWIYHPEVLLCAIQAVGWIGICAQSFFWTSWRGETTGCIDLALQGVVGVITAAMLPMVNRHVGAATVWCASELLFHLLMMSIALVPRESSTGTIPRIISAFSGINYAVHATNGLLVAANVVADESKRARTIAMVNNTLPMGQLVTAVTGGMIAQTLGGFDLVLVCYGFFGAIVTSFVWVISSRKGLFVAPE